jgi:phosphoenolpyruvate synthase/pyruvate phosphate dikinase
MNERAKTYRRINRIDDWLGTAVNVQAMVFGNLGETPAPASASPAIPPPASTPSSAST